MMFFFILHTMQPTNINTAIISNNSSEDNNANKVLLHFRLTYEMYNIVETWFLYLFDFYYIIVFCVCRFDGLLVCWFVVFLVNQFRCMLLHLLVDS